MAETCKTNVSAEKATVCYIPEEENVENILQEYIIYISLLRLFSGTRNSTSCIHTSLH
jgi:hypothetical protein